MAEEDRTLLFGEGNGPVGVRPPYLVIVDGPHKGARFPLQEGVNIVGRLDEDQVVLDDQSVSRKHAEVAFTNGSWTVQDLGSKNGTYVNGALLSEAVVVGHKDLIRTGIYTLRLITQEISQDEELEVSQEEIGEWGTIVVPPEKKGGTSRVGVEQKEITAPHSPLEESEDLARKTSIQPLERKRGWLPKARMWVLGALLFSVVLSATLYFYWVAILAPRQEAAEKVKDSPLAAVPSYPIQTIPFGPPEPAKPQTIPVFLDCIANPFPATVRFQEREVGKTPLKINVELLPGESYEMEAVFDMPEIQEKYTDRLRFSVDRDQSVIPLLFRAPIGTVKIISLPRDVALYLEAYFEYDPFQPRAVKLHHVVLNKPIYAPYGRYILELRKPKPVGGDAAQMVDAIIFRREFVLKEDQPTYALDLTEAALRQFPAEIRSIPSGADVFIDSQKVGQTPFAGTLPVGPHKLTLRKEGYFETTQDIVTDINTPFKMELTLKTSPAGEKLNAARGNLRQGLYQEAVQNLSDAFTLNPSPRETAEARYLLGEIFLQMRDFSKAEGYFTQAMEHEEFKYPAKLGVAGALAEQQKTRQALIPLVEVLLNAKDLAVQREAHEVLRRISPLRSVVYIQSDPAAAAVYLNDKKLEQVTPILLHEVALGSYRIRIEKPGFETQNLTINLSVNEFNPVLTKLKPLPQ